MKFEITYQNGTKVVVEVVDPELRTWLDGKAKIQAAQVADKVEAGRGIPMAAKVIA